jgi:glycosyltransferase involved in cell wall biosynthesis
MSVEAGPGSVSVVIPCFNDGAHVVDAVASASAQTHPATEIIVVDDGSTDPATLAALDTCRSPTVRVHRQTNQGVSAARNTGIRLADGEYILPLDSDDLVSADYALLGARVLDARPAVGIVGGEIELFGLVSGHARPAFDGVEGMLFSNNLYTCSMTRRSDWARVGGYPEHVRFAEDWIYWLRILSLKREVHLLDETVWFYRQRAGQTTRRMDSRTWTQAVVHAMRDQPDLYAEHIGAVTDYLEMKLSTLDGFRRRYGRINDLAARMRSLGQRGRR